MRHAICGPSMRFCLKSWEYAELAKQFNNPDEIATRAAITSFVEQLEQSGGPIGIFKDVEASFRVWLRSIGKGPAPVVKPFRVQDMIDREAARKAGKVS